MVNPTNFTYTDSDEPVNHDMPSGTVYGSSENSKPKVKKPKVVKLYTKIRIAHPNMKHEAALNLATHIIQGISKM